MSVTETMTRIYALLDKHTPKYMTPVNVALTTKGKYDIRRGRPLTESEKREAKRMRAAGMIYDDIAAHIGVCRTTVYRAIKPTDNAR
jgi:DNA invertase Pin-like site-specific DNA recombinase